MPPDLEFEEFSEVNDRLAELMEAELAFYKREKQPLDVARVVQEYLKQYPQKRHFDVTRIIIDQAVKLGIAEADLAGLPSEWLAINDYGAKVQAHVIDKY